MKQTITILSLLLCFLLSAQKPADASRLFEEGNFAEAAEINRKLLKKKPKDAVLNARLARCLQALGNTDEAIEHFRIAAENGYDKANLYLGDIFFDAYFFAEAAEVYEIWTQSDKITNEEKNAAEKRLQQARLGAELLQRVEDIALIDSIVTPKQDFFKQIAIPREIGTFFASKNDEIGFESGRKDRRYSTQHNGEQSDLYQSFKLMDEWSEPMALSAILNTEKNENFPFVAADGITIYFGSEGHENLGGYDIFTSRYNSDTDRYLPPQNVGFPFNSTGNDYMMAFDEMAGIGWFVTDRFRNDDSVTIYRFIPNAQRLILRNKTDDELRNAALLCTFRTAEAPQKVVLLSETEQKNSEKEFIVNDTTIYKSEKEFKNEDARKKFVSLRELKIQLEQKKFTLQAKRELWAISETEHERTHLANEILALEKSILLITQQIERYENEIRETENDTLLELNK